ncbi:putative damage-inducible protein DinB [Chitinophaga niastensis]|uniref:Putative damage-inducible protein DinB n=1 Tax=Chitinophaga niastensis TaxID=536980 RepID=A0A2P8HVA2_CHINA|nr:DinB family protein [Chitinophaga niastensis]PSL50140.1 putative damage-inducible protein DinB [Chitinophaga niastensis]
MKEILVHYSSYNYWANQQLLKVLLKLTDEQQDRELGGSLSSLRKTVYHLWREESLWHQRLQLVEKATDPTNDFSGSFATACEHWVRQSLQLQEWVQKATPVKLNHTIAYTQKKSEHHKIAVHQVIMHACNHAAFYRGQLVYMLQQLGVSKIPDTDYNRFKPKK